MAMTTVLVLVESSEHGRRTVRAAFQAARRDGGHVVGLYPVPPSERLTPQAMYFSRASLEVPGQDGLAMLDRAERDGGAGVETARHAFEEVAAEMGATLQERPPNPGRLTAFFRSQADGDPEAVAALGRVFDLVVVQQPREDPDHRIRKLLRAVLFQAGRPVLVVPPDPSASLGTRPLIAWNGSARSARAAAIARNFFDGAREIGILSVRTKNGSGPSAQDLADYVAWHDMKASVLEATLANHRLGDVFLREAGRFGADLLVMGAYAQSPFRESLTGGVTNHVLSHAALPVLMTH
ncbi:MAG: universal stress protein [Kiloniellales bacterium]|nr:universal stress protein [Kiloniellales bacterium]